MNDRRVQWFVFGGIGALVTVMAAIYWLGDDEHAGTVLLALAAGLAWFTAAYLWLADRRLERDTSEADADDEYLPHASVWPLGIGVAVLLMANGLILGVLFLVPGALLLALSVAGLATQSRHRT